MIISFTRYPHCSPSGIFQKNNSRMLEEIIRQQRDLLGVDVSKHSIEFLSNGSDTHQQHGKALAKLLPFDDNQVRSFLNLMHQTLPRTI